MASAMVRGQCLRCPYVGRRIDVHCFACHALAMSRNGLVLVSRRDVDLVRRSSARGRRLVGVAHADFAKALGTTKLSAQIYNAGPAEMTALLGGQLDAAYVGPSAALSAYVQSHGEALKIVAGATTGGAELVVKPDITSA